jgi:hypothetical protein
MGQDIFTCFLEKLQKLRESASIIWSRLARRPRLGKIALSELVDLALCIDLQRRCRQNDRQSWGARRERRAHGCISAELALGEGYQHPYPLLIAPVGLAVHGKQIMFLEVDANEDVPRRRHREEQMANGHVWCRPKHQQEAHHHGMADQPI